MSADWIFKRLEDEHPEYYESAGQPSFMALGLRRQGIANDLLMKAMFGNLPKDFPDDAEIRKRIGTLQTLFLLVALPAWIGLFILMFTSVGE